MDDFTFNSMHLDPSYNLYAVSSASSLSPSGLNTDRSSETSPAENLGFFTNTNDNNSALESFNPVLLQSTEDDPDMFDEAEAQEPAKPYHPKRPHKKSRKGCKNCKARKVKCDEARPVCKSCRLRKVECFYANPESPPLHSTTANKSNKAPPATKGAVGSSGSGKQRGVTTSVLAVASESDGLGFSFNSDAYDETSMQLVQTAMRPVADSFEVQNPLGIVISEPMYNHISTDMTDMKLLWFYTAHTSSCFTIDAPRKDELENLMKSTMVRHAFDAPFLMHSIFALTSNHMQNLGHIYDGRKALQYRALAFEGYRRAVEEAKPETFPALLANSLILCAVSSQSFREADGKDMFLVDWMIVWRGIGIIVELMGLQAINSSGLLPLFHRPPMSLEDAPNVVPNSLLFMVACIKPSDPDFENVQAYYEALRYLGVLYSELRFGYTPRMVLRIVTWPTFVPGPFIELIRAHKPRALVIVAHYALFLKLVTGIWWLDRVGERSIKDFCAHLVPESVPMPSSPYASSFGMSSSPESLTPSPWAPFMRAPLAARETNDLTQLHRIIFEDESYEPPVPDMTREESLPPPGWVDDMGRETAIKEVNGQADWVLLHPDDENPEPVWNMR